MTQSTSYLKFDTENEEKHKKDEEDKLQRVADLQRLHDIERQRREDEERRQKELEQELFEKNAQEAEAQLKEISD